jgi:hypothetical protein
MVRRLLAAIVLAAIVTLSPQQVLNAASQGGSLKGAI